MTDSMVNNGVVRKIGQPNTEPQEATEPSSYAVNGGVQASTAVQDGRAVRMDEWMTPEPPLIIRDEPAFLDEAGPTGTVSPTVLRSPIIAIHGDYGAGKSTLAQVITLAYGGTVLPLADVLRESLVKSGIPREVVYQKPTPPEVRELLEAHAKLTTKLMGDSHYADAWAGAAYAYQHTHPNLPIIVDDLRRPAELRALWAAGAMIISFVPNADSPDPLAPDLTHIQRSMIETRGMLHSLAAVSAQAESVRIQFISSKRVKLPGMLNSYVATQHIKELNIIGILEHYLVSRGFGLPSPDLKEPGAAATIP